MLIKKYYDPSLAKCYKWQADNRKRVYRTNQS